MSIISLTRRQIEEAEELRLHIHNTIIGFFSKKKEDCMYSTRFLIAQKALEVEHDLLNSFAEWEESIY